ncbi:MAG: hypothetical protein AB7O24_00145 [Kofleriaceae bacterium]
MTPRPRFVPPAGEVIPPNVEVVGRVVEVSGHVYAWNADRSRRDLVAGDWIDSDDDVETDDGRVLIEVTHNGALVEAGPKRRFTVKQTAAWSLVGPGREITQVPEPPPFELPPGPGTRRPPKRGQGIYGWARVLTGNFMPSTGGPRNNRIEPARTFVVHVFHGTHTRVERLAPNDRSHVAATKTDHNGYFELALRSGTYTIVIDVGNGELYRNCFDGDASTDEDHLVWCSTDVSSKWQRVDLDDDRNTTH